MCNEDFVAQKALKRAIVFPRLTTFGLFMFRCTPDAAKWLVKFNQLAIPQIHPRLPS